MNYLSFLVSQKGLGVIVSLLVSVWVARLVLKKYKPQPVLFLGGIVLFAAVILIGMVFGEPSQIIGNPNLPPDHILSRIKSLDKPFLDIFVSMEGKFSNRVAGLGLLIMSVMGFVKYMDAVGANNALVRIGVKPLQFIKSPYLVVVLAFFLGQTIKLAITSASGLGVLLMATMFPVLIQLGVSRATAVAVIATTGCIDIGPATGTGIAVVEAAGILTSDGRADMARFFVNYQLPVAIPVLIVVAVLHFFTQRWFDKKEGYTAQPSQGIETGSSSDGIIAPSFYAVLPLLPLSMVLIFNEAVLSQLNNLLASVGSSIEIPARTMGLVTAIFFTLFLTMMIEYFRFIDAKKVFDSIQTMFDGMGVAFATVITLIVAGEVFAAGLLTTGSVNTLLTFIKDAGAGVVPITIFMQSLISISSVLMGSGDAAIFSFLSVGTVIANHFGVEPIAVLMPMQICSSLARSFSPITAVVVAVSAIAGISPVDVVKRTIIPMIGGIITLTIVNTILFL